MKKIVAMLLVVAIAMVAFAGCVPAEGDVEPTDETPTGEQPTEPTDVVETVGGTIMYLSNLQSGPEYDASLAFLNAFCDELGYKLTVIYGDMMNDPAGNLSAVKNGMTSDVVGIIACQDGGIKDILAEYPELFIIGSKTDMASVYSEGGASAEAATNPNFLGTIADGFVSGVDIGKQYAEIVIEKGYKKVSTIAFPEFAYPQLVIADATFRDEIADYNKTAQEPIEIVGESTILMFEPLADSYFMEPDHQDLDCVVAFCAGVLFVYPTMKTAMNSGTISADTKMITGGFDSDENILADIGEDGVIQAVIFAPTENIIYALALLDNAIQGAQYADYSASERIDSSLYVIDSKEDIDNVLEKTMAIKPDMQYSVISVEDAKPYFTRYNPDATYAELKELIASDRMTVEYLK